MGAHETADAVLTRLEADRLRAYARDLLAELDDIASDTDHGEARIWRWSGKAAATLQELADG